MNLLQLPTNQSDQALLVAVILLAAGTVISFVFAFYIIRRNQQVEARLIAREERMGLREDKLVEHNHRLMDIVERFADWQKNATEQMVYITNSLRNIELKLERMDARSDMTHTERVTTTTVIQPRLARRQLLTAQSAAYDRKISEFRMELSGLADTGRKFELQQAIEQAEKEQRTILDEIDQIDRYK